MREASNRTLLRVPKDVLLVALMLVIAIAMFGLGMLSERQMSAPKGRGVWVEQTATGSPSVLGASAVGAVTSAVVAGAVANSVSEPTQPSQPKATAPILQTGTYVASKNGTKYYLASCSGAKRIKAENKVWFATVQDAEASGRTPASNCPGL